MSQEEIEAERKAQYEADMAQVKSQCLGFGYKTTDTLFPWCISTMYSQLIDARNLQFQQRMAAFQAISDAGRAMQGKPSDTYKCKKDFSVIDSYTCESQ